METLQQERKAREFEKEVSQKEDEISNLKRELLKKDKVLEERLKQANMGTASLSDAKARLEKQVCDLLEKLKKIEQEDSNSAKLAEEKKELLN